MNWVYNYKTGMELNKLVIIVFLGQRSTGVVRVEVDI